jgi:hypothetical protein
VRDTWAADVAQLKAASQALAGALPESADEARTRQAEIESLLARYAGQ